MATGANLQGNFPCILPIKGTVHKNGLMSLWRCQQACVDHTEWVSLRVIEWNCLHNYFPWIENQQPSLGSGNKPLLKPYGTILRRDVITGPLPSEILSQEFFKGVTYVWEPMSSFPPPAQLWKSQKFSCLFHKCHHGPPRCSGSKHLRYRHFELLSGPRDFVLIRRKKMLLIQWNVWFVNPKSASFFFF